jgi:hypothetical protein
MNHRYFCDGNEKRISWMIQNNEIVIKQQRDHAKIYFNKVSIEQSKYIALHAGIFWSIGRFIMKNDDFVQIMLDLKSMYDHLIGNNQNQDKIIESKTNFIKQLIKQRNLRIQFVLIEPHQNLATKILST